MERICLKIVVKSLMPTSFGLGFVETSFVANLDGQPKLLSQSLANLLAKDMDPDFMDNIDSSNLMDVAQRGPMGESGHA
jgi:hypothetical protein